MTPAESNLLAQAVNLRNAHVTERAEALASVLLAIALGLLGAWALVLWATPCDGAALCIAVVTPTRTSLWGRIVNAVRAARLRWHIAETEAILFQIEADLVELPHARECLLIARDAARLRLQDIELNSRTT